jgi:hypothetical protein
VLRAEGRSGLVGERGSSTISEGGNDVQTEGSEGKSVNSVDTPLLSGVNPGALSDDCGKRDDRWNTGKNSSDRKSSDARAPRR